MPTTGMKTLSKWLGLLLLCTASQGVSAGEPWQDALAAMPLTAPTAELNRTNCVPLLLDSFQSNGVVKGLIFMPGATDELFFFRRAHATLTNTNPSLLDAVTALTNQTFIQATFQPPLLLLHNTEDALDVITIVKNKSTAAKLRQKLVPGRVLLNDADWGVVRNTFKGKLSIGLRPFENALETWQISSRTGARAPHPSWNSFRCVRIGPSVSQHGEKSGLTHLRTHRNGLRRLKWSGSRLSRSLGWQRIETGCTRGQRRLPNTGGTNETDECNNCMKN